MIKAKSGEENNPKPNGLMSVLSSLGGKPAVQDTNASEESGSTQNLSNRPVPIVPPPVYVKNAYNDIIEKHNQIVKKILKSNKIK